MIEDDPRIDPADLRKAKFPGSFRRYDAKAVEDFLESVAKRVVATNEVIDQLRRELESARSVRKVEPARSPFDPPDLSAVSEDELLRLVGEETAHVLSTARKAASDIRGKAEESASRMIREATTEATRIVEEAEATAESLTTEAAGARDAAVGEAEAAATEIREAAEAEAETVRQQAAAESDEITAAAQGVLDEAKEEAERILEEAREEGRSMVNEAKAVRTRVLEDLQRRRDLGRSQVERLATGRDQLLAAYAAVRQNVEAITAQLEGPLLPPADDPALEEGFVGVVDTGDDVLLDGIDGDDGSAAASEAADTDVVTEDETDEAAEAAEAEGDEPGAEDSGDSEDAADVDALFARIRSERAESVARAQRVLAGEGDEADEEPAAEPEDTDEGGESGPGADHVDRALLAADDDLALREEALAPLDKRLARALKRHLADEQNLVLDALRRTESTDPDQLLPPEADHVGGYARVAQKVLKAAADAGAGGGSGEVDVAELAEALGRALILPFRRRIERSAEDVDGDPDTLDERLRALYREWKVEHIGPAAADALLSAFALGQYEAAPDAASLRWLIDPSQGPCPDAQDNALAGAVTKGEAFPTGDRCPQAHPGCRCLLVVES